jgi:hypothetical protein
MCGRSTRPAFRCLRPNARFLPAGRGRFRVRRTQFPAQLNDRASNNGRPFFSRNIGLVSGTPVSIIAGGKLSGDYGGFGIGALTVMTNQTPTTSEQVLSVARITHPIFTESKFASSSPMAIRPARPATRLQVPTSNISTPFHGQQDRLGRRLLRSKFLEQTRGRRFYRACFGYRTSPGGAISSSSRSAKIFNRARLCESHGYPPVHRKLHQPQPISWHYLNQLEFDTNYEFITDLHDRLESRYNDVTMRLASTPGDEITFKLTRNTEVVPARAAFFCLEEFRSFRQL